VLVAAGVVKGHKVSAYPAVGPDVTVGGGEFAAAAARSVER